MSVFLSRVTVLSVRSVCNKTFAFRNLAEPITSNVIGITRAGRHFSIAQCCRDSIQPTVPLENTSLPLKKKVIHKKVLLENLPQKEGQYLAIAYATANSYDLASIKDGLLRQKLYEPATLMAPESGDVLVASAKYSVDKEPREIFFFREGAVVFWNCNDVEATNVLDFIKRYEHESYPREVVEKEREIMPYMYQNGLKKCQLVESTFNLVPKRDNNLERYTFSHAMAQSARLGAWEEKLETLASSVSDNSRLMERGEIALTKDQVVRKLGELFSLRHRLNVESDLLDTPDFYWEEEELEQLYSNTVAYFTIPRRTRVLNERLSHCVELLQLLSQWTADRQHIRLEWMIIVLILVEVCFELLHFAERYLFTRLRTNEHYL